MNKIKYLVCFLLFSYSSIAQLPNSWNKVANFSSTAREAGVSFSIDSFGYVGLGTYTTDSTVGLQFPLDFWQYNPYTNVWTQKASFPGVGRENAMSFVIGSKAYVGFGDNYTFQGMSDFWEYDPSSDTWTQKADFGGGQRDFGMGFSVGTKGYAGSGYCDTAALGSQVKNDLWQYDPVSNSWTQLNDFPISGRIEAALFNIGAFEYVGFGFTYQNQTQTNDIWKYDPSSDSWAQLADFPGDTISSGSFTFSVGEKGYFEVYYDSIPNDYSSASHSMYFWQYNPSSDTWSMKDSFTGGMRQGVASFTIGNHGYAGIGSPYYPGNCVTDFWMYTPDSIATGIKGIDANIISVYPDPATGRLYISGISNDATFSITDITGRVCATPTGSEIDVSVLPAGMYCLRIENSNGSSLVKKFTKL